MLDLQAVTLSDMSRETHRDDILSKLVAQIQSGKWSRDDKFKPFSAIRDELSVYDGVILRGNRILVPPSLRKKVLKLSHETHQGIVKTKQFLRSRFYWPGMDEATEAMIKNCRACILNQPLNKYTPLQPAALPRGPWVKGAVDIVGPINGKFILTYIDYYSSYPEAYVLREITSRDVIKVLTDIFARFGFPEEIVSDNGKQFVSAEFENFLKSCGIKHTRVSPYFARSNGKLERFHRYLKKNFRAAMSEGKSWEEELPKILMTYRASPHPVSGETPTKLLFNHEIRMKVPHVDMSNRDSKLDQEIRSKCEKYQERMKNYHDEKRHATPHNFSIGDVVFCANMKPNKLDSQFYPAKHVIIKTQGRDTFTLVNAATGTTLIRNAKYLKHVPASEEVIESSKDEPSDNPDSTSSLDSSATSQNSSDACSQSEHTSPSVTQATQNENIVTNTRSGRTVKSTKDNDNFVYY